MVVGGPHLNTSESSVSGGGNVRRALCRKAPKHSHSAGEPPHPKTDIA